MNTLEMVKILRNNPELKAQRKNHLGETWTMKCVNGSIVWVSKEEGYEVYGEYLIMVNTILDLNDWIIVNEENIPDERYNDRVYFSSEIKLNNGIGKLPEDKIPIKDIYVKTSNDKMHTIRPIGNQFSVPTNDTIVRVVYPYYITGNYTKIMIDSNNGFSIKSYNKNGIEIKSFNIDKNGTEIKFF